MVGKFFGIETASVVCDAGDLAGRLPTEIGHHRDAAAIASKAVMEIVAASHMRQCVEGKRDIAGPGMSDLDAAQLREAIGHVAVQDRRANNSVYLCEPGAAAEYHTPAVR